DLPYRAVQRICHVNISQIVYRDALRIIEPRLAPSAVVRARNACSAGHRAYDSSRSNLAYEAIVGVGHINVARAVHRHSGGSADTCVFSGAISARRAIRPPGESAHDSSSGDLPDGIVVSVSHPKGAFAIGHDTVRLVEQGAAAGSIAAPWSSRLTGHSGY